MVVMQVQEEDEVILVDFAAAPGVRGVSRESKNLVEQSKQALDNAMKSMRGMAKRTMKSIREIPLSERPSSISVSFGLKLDAEAGALIAKAGAEASINVTMTWTRVEKKR